jgi:hypothetical protein
MPRSGNALCLTVCVVLSVILAVPSLSAKPLNIRDFVTTRYIHGIPYEEAKAYGPVAVPTLEEMLRDESLAPYWENIVGTLGYIGDPRAVEVLTSFLSSLNGEVPIHKFRAALAVPAALGHLAASDQEALRLLMQFADQKPSKGVALSFTFKRYQGSALDEVLGRLAIQGLGFSGSLQALAFLEAKRRGIRADWEDNVMEAIEMNKRIHSKGAVKVFGHGN